MLKVRSSSSFVRGIMDPLSEVLSLLKPQSYVSRVFRIEQHTAIRWPAHEGIKCYAIVAGECWLTVEGVADAMPLRAGDCILKPPGSAFCMGTDRSVAPVDFMAMRDSWNRGEWADAQEFTHDEAGGCALFGGHFTLTGGPADLLLHSLPPIVHLRREAEREAMRWSLERMKEEVRDPQPGGSLIAQQLAYMMLVQALRLHMAEGGTGTGWLFALADKQMRTAITCMHEQPGHPWTLQELAGRVGMSRSIFALRFKLTVGTSPMEYLTRWRMLLAGERLRSTKDSIAEIASSMGYDSESAFGKAFRRIMGYSPRQHTAAGRKWAVDSKDVHQSQDRTARLA